jgi:hypothetical protein
LPTRPTGGPQKLAKIETLSENLIDKSAVYLPERVIRAPHRKPQTQGSERVNAAWREAVKPILTTVLAEPDLRAVERVWRPEHCEALEAVAEALDQVWATAVPAADETTLVLRVAGLPSVTAALVADVADRSAATAREPVPLTGELLRFTGVAICAGTHNAVTCGRLRHELEGVPEVPDEGMVRLLGTGYARALTASTAEMTIHDFLDGLGAQPDRVRIAEPPEPVPDAPIGPIGQSRAAVAGVGDAPPQAVTFGR